MDLSDVQVGKTYIYYPPKETIDDNRHWPATVLEIGKRVRVRLHSPEGGGTTHQCSAPRRRSARNESLIHP